MRGVHVARLRDGSRGGRGDDDPDHAARNGRPRGRAAVRHPRGSDVEHAIAAPGAPRVGERHRYDRQEHPGPGSRWRARRGRYGRDGRVAESVGEGRTGAAEHDELPRARLQRRPARSARHRGTHGQTDPRPPRIFVSTPGPAAPVRRARRTSSSCSATAWGPRTAPRRASCRAACTTARPSGRLAMDTLDVTGLVMTSL